MKRKYPFRWLLGVVFVCLISFTACNYPPMAQPTNDLAAATWTAISETIAAQLTQSVSTRVPGTGDATPATGEPGQTPTGAPTSSDTPIPPTATLEPTPSGIPATLGAEDPRQRFGDPEWMDTFENSTNWPIYEDDHASMTIENGILRMTSFKAEVWNSWMLSWPVVEDFYLEAVMTPQTACSAGDHYGILARGPSASEAYLFGITCDGRYSLRTWDGQSFQALVNWTPSEHILTGVGQTNRVGVLAQGQQIQLYINGRLLAEVEDATYDQGAFGPFIGSMDTPNFTVEVTEIGYWNLP